MDHGNIFARGRLSAGIPYPPPLVLSGSSEEYAKLLDRVERRTTEESEKREKEEKEKGEKEEEGAEGEGSIGDMGCEEVAPQGIIIVDGYTSPKEQ